MAKKIIVTLDTSTGLIEEELNSNDVGEDIFTYYNETTMSIGTTQAGGNKYKHLRDFPINRIVKVEYK